ncbi:hypothetical protein ACJMK2_023331 [Sinanodonta woodiana]|uniref:BTB domain-containing protein n=1 Tax=Sinanodonta woodiana TaxID=1069815 RepID=A0ABD3T3V8_SINWO
MERYDSRAGLLDFDQMDIWVSSDGSSGYESTGVFDAESVRSYKNKECSTDESEMTNFKSLHALGHSMSYITDVPDLCDVKFLVGDDEVPVYGVKAVLGTRSRYFYSLILKHMKNAEENRTSKRLPLRKSKKCYRKSNHLEIPIRSYDIDVFRRLIQFVHSGTVNITMKTVVGVLCGAVQFGFKDLETACQEMVQRGISRGRTKVLITSARECSQHESALEILSKLCGEGYVTSNR